MPSRKLDDLHPEVMKKALRFLTLAKQKYGIDVLIYCTYRSPEEQEVLYLQGRYDKLGITLEELNEKRKKLGLYPLTEKEAKKIVTNAKPWQSAHQYKVAFDCVPIVAGKPDWNNINLYKKLAEIGKEVGLDWAGEWKTFKEYPHFQDTKLFEELKFLHDNL